MHNHTMYVKIHRSNAHMHNAWITIKQDIDTHNNYHYNVSQMYSNTDWYDWYNIAAEGVLTTLLNIKESGN